MAVLPNGSSCQPIHIRGRNRFQDLLKIDRRNMMALIDNHHPYRRTKDFTPSSVRQDCMRATSTHPCKLFPLESNVPKGEKYFFLPRFGTASSTGYSNSRNSSNRTFHCSNKVLVCTRIKAFTLRSAIRPMAVTVCRKLLFHSGYPDHAASAHVRLRLVLRATAL